MGNREGIYCLDGRVPLAKAVPFGLQHVLAMFVGNLVPITVVGGMAGFSKELMTVLVQNAMFIAGIATLIQLFPVWRIGARLPIVMGISFTFLPALCFVTMTYSYEATVGAVLIGGIFEGTLGLLAKYWRRFITPVVTAIVVTTIGYSLLGVGVRSFGGGYTESFGSPLNLVIGTVTLATCLLVSALATGYKKQLSILAGIAVGYLIAWLLGIVNLSDVFAGKLISLPVLLPVMPEFNPAAIISMGIIYLVSAAETIGDSSAVAMMGLDRPIEERELTGALACDGYGSAISSLFGCPPVSSFSQNVGLIAMTKVINRFTIAVGAVFLLCGGLFPALGAFFVSLPEPVLGGCTIMMFGSIMVSGIRMLADAGFSQRNITIAALSFALGIGSTSGPEAAIWGVFPKLVQDVFSSNCVAVVFVVAVILSLVLPEDMEII